MKTKQNKNLNELTFYADSGLDRDDGNAYNMIFFLYFFLVTIIFHDMIL